MELYIATNGNDAWSGLFPAPNRTKTDGPLASLAGARDRLRALRDLGNKNQSPRPTPALTEPVTVWVRGGRYELRAPVVFESADSFPVLFAAYRNERPVFDGGQRITGWQPTTVKGRRAWATELTDVAAGDWEFRSLFVNGRRAARPRWPRTGLFQMAAVPGLKLPAGWGQGGQTTFIAAAGETREFKNLRDVEAVYVHFWIEERSPLAAVDVVTRTVTMCRPSRTALVGSPGSQLADYYYDNVFEELGEPGQWYLDRPAGRLYYLPRPGETPATTEVIAPRSQQLVGVIGAPDKGRYVECLRFRGLTFCHTDWRYPEHDGAVSVAPPPARPMFSRRHGRGAQAAAAQAACDVPGVIVFEGARHCAVEDCVIERVGWYGVEISDGCRAIRVVGNTLRDLGAGGVKINGAAARDHLPERETGNCRLTDNVITMGGRVFHSAVGVLSMHAAGLVIAHNHIHNLYYTGISCGWEWGYQENASHDNRIENNHIHNIGQALLSDMGGIYTLGVQPGTVIRGNLIHDIRSAHYGGWCMYPDEGSSHILIEQNVCFNADRHAFHQHYGRENMVRNNIFAFGGEAVVAYSRTDDHTGFTFTHNICVTDGQPIFAGGYQHRLADRKLRSDLNLFFDIAGRPLVCGTPKREHLSWPAWRKLGQDLHSAVGDPQFVNLRRRDFRLKRTSPALKLGFAPIDLRQVGPRPRRRRD
jgi:hypothetical protein